MDDGPSGGAWQQRPRQTRAGVIVGCILLVIVGLAIFYTIDPGYFRAMFQDLGLR
jgi:Mg/Co/Ni transporter MgtE